MQRTVIVIAVVVVLVGFLGFIVLPWLQQALFGEAKQVSGIILEACIDNEVEVPGAKGATVPKIVAVVELTFKFGDEPDSVQEFTVQDDENNPVDVNWGRQEPDKRPNESKGKTALIIREAFFPTDFKQGKLFDKNKKYLCYLRMPPATLPCDKRP